ncbi:type I restriction endonuclease subunit R, partial [Vibrio parahaemolyticus]
PPLAEQKRIAAILDKADAIRQKRKQAIELADEFLRSVFLDMFGDPVTNPKGWEVKKLSNIAHIQIGPFGTQLHKEDYIENGIPLINPTHIVQGSIVPNSNLTISSKKHRELSEYHLKAGDIVMGRRGEMGRCAIVHEQEAGWLCGTGSVFIRPQNIGVFSEYLNKLLSSQAIKKHLESESQGATMPNLNKTIVGNIQIP